MAAAKDYTGQQYGRLTAIRRVGDRGGTWLFECACGNQVTTNIARVRAGQATSCGCARFYEVSGKLPKYTPEERATLRVYRSMRNRCYRKNTASYANYGARGVTVCARWLDSFENFLADMGPRPSGLSIDRVDTNGNYEPSNCRWATSRQQSANKRTTFFVFYNGVKVPLAALAREHGVSYHPLYARIKYLGERPESAVAALKNRMWVEHNGAHMTLKAFADATGVNYKNLHSAMKRHNLTPSGGVEFVRRKLRTRHAPS